VCSRWRWMLGRGVLWLVTMVPWFSPRGNWCTAAATRLHPTFFTATTTGRSHHCQNTKYVPLFFIILSPSVNFTSLISRCFGHEHQFARMIPFRSSQDATKNSWVLLMGRWMEASMRQRWSIPRQSHDSASIRFSRVLISVSNWFSHRSAFEENRQSKSRYSFQYNFRDHIWCVTISTACKPTMKLSFLSIN